MPDQRDILGEVVGTQLSAITFVLDYYQFQFDGPTFTVVTPVEVVSDSGRTKSGEDQFRNHACVQIGKIVSRVTVEEERDIVVEFRDGSRLSFSLRDADRRGPEAVIYQGLQDRWNVY